jgi:ketosteroid isomerase-like protein
MGAADVVQLVEEAYRTWNERGPRAFAEEFATGDVRVEDPPELPDAGTWTGRDAIVARIEDVVAATGGRWADIDEVQPVGDEVLVSLTWRLERGGTASLGCVYHLVRVRDGRIARMRVFLAKTAALRAAAV